MPIAGSNVLSIQCQCGRHLKVPASAIGHAGKCPFCHVGLRLVAPGYEEGGAAFTERLVITSGPVRAGEQLLFGGPGPIEIGKLPGKPILLPGNKVSRAHCRLVRFNGRWLLEDQGSKNGTLVNGQRITRHRLVDGDAVQVGEFLLHFAGTAPATPADEPAPAQEQHALQRDPAREPRSMSAAPAAVAGSGISRPPEAAGDDEAAIDDDELYGLALGQEIEVVSPPEKEPKPPPPADGPTCPGCRQQFPKTARICVNCGIDLKTGRAILTSSEDNLDEIYSTVESVLRVASWIVPVGVFPVASEALGVRRPYATWAIAAITVLISGASWIAVIKDPDRLKTYKQYMHWVGEALPTAEDIEWQYESGFGDYEAYALKRMEFEAFVEERKLKDVTEDDIARRALAALPLEDRCYGEYEPSQLITCTLLHGGLMHLIGNIIFLLVIGGRVNAMAGNAAMIVLYPLLAVTSGLIEGAVLADELPAATIGASGAIMGLAGAYFILTPVHKVHVVAWWRWSLIRRFHLSMKIFAMSGFWVLLFYIGFDVVATLLGSEDGVAHWAHLGGFLSGMGVGLVLIVARLVNARGGDLLTALLGRRAWWLIGKPDTTRRSPIAIF